MGNGVMATGPKLPRPSLTLPLSPFAAMRRFRPVTGLLLSSECGSNAVGVPRVRSAANSRGRIELDARPDGGLRAGPNLGRAVHHRRWWRAVCARLQPGARPLHQEPLLRRNDLPARYI